MDEKQMDEDQADIKRSRKSKMKKRPEDWERLKQEIAAELGLSDKVRQDGWSGLSAEESGRLGGVFAKRKHDLKQAQAEADFLAGANFPGAAPPLAQVVENEIFPEGRE